MQKYSSLIFFLERSYDKVVVFYGNQHMATRTQVRWQRAIEAQQALVSSPANRPQIDLAKPDASAAELADTLQTIAANSLFTRVALFITNWIVRPFFWWPIKYTGKLAWWSLRNTKSSDSEQWERRRDLWDRN